MIEETRQDAKQSMDKAVEALKRDLTRVRTAGPRRPPGRGAGEYYGAPPPSTRWQRLHPGAPADPGPTVGPLHLPRPSRRHLQERPGVTPQSDGKVVRIGIPALTGERRRELAKVVRKMGEETKVAVRNSRRDANEMLKEYKK